MTPPNASLRRLIANLPNLPVPDADDKRAGSGPLYDNLVGAHYALSEAEAIWEASGGVVDYGRRQLAPELRDYSKDKKRDSADLGFRHRRPADTIKEALTVRGKRN